MIFTLTFVFVSLNVKMKRVNMRMRNSAAYAATCKVLSYSNRPGKTEVSYMRYETFLSTVEPDRTNQNNTFASFKSRDHRGDINFVSGHPNSRNYVMKINKGNKPVRRMTVVSAQRFDNRAHSLMPGTAEEKETLLSISPLTNTCFSTGAGGSYCVMLMGLWKLLAAATEHMTSWSFDPRDSHYSFGFHNAVPSCVVVADMGTSTLHAHPCGGMLTVTRNSLADLAHHAEFTYFNEQ